MPVTTVTKSCFRPVPVTPNPETFVRGRRSGLIDLEKPSHTPELRQKSLTDPSDIVNGFPDLPMQRPEA